MQPVRTSSLRIHSTQAPSHSSCTAIPLVPVSHLNKDCRSTEAACIVSCRVVRSNQNSHADLRNITGRISGKVHMGPLEEDGQQQWRESTQVLQKQRTGLGGREAAPRGGGSPAQEGKERRTGLFSSKINPGLKCMNVRLCLCRVQQPCCAC